MQEKYSDYPQSVVETPWKEEHIPAVAQAVLEKEALKDLTSCCKGIDDLINWLDSIDRRPGLEELDLRLSNMRVNDEALKKHIAYAEKCYQRNVIKRSEHYELVAICWKPDQETPIHDHIGSDCAFLIIEGTSTETVYEKAENGLVVAVKNRTYAPGEVCAAAEQDIHKVSNQGDSNLINLHVYTPPLSQFNVYSPAA